MSLNINYDATHRRGQKRARLAGETINFKFLSTTLCGKFARGVAAEGRLTKPDTCGFSYQILVLSPPS